MLRLPVKRNLEGVPVSVAEALTVPTVAWMVVGPSSRSVAIPAGETVATFVADDVHVALAVTLPKLASENVPVAVNGWVAPTGTDRFWGVSEIEVNAKTLSVSADELLPM